MGRYNQSTGVAVFGLSVFLCQVTLIVGLSIGWVFNLLALIDCDFEAPYKVEIIRGVAAVAAPIGGIVGYLNIEDSEPEE